MTERLNDDWLRFSGGLRARGDRLCQELTSAWDDLRALIASVAAASDSVSRTPPDAVRVQSLEALFNEASERLLFTPLAEHQRKRPLHRALSAIEDYEAALEVLISGLPEQVEAKSRELARTIDPDGRSGLRRRWLEWRNASLALPLRDIVSGFLLREQLWRSRIEGNFLVALSQATLLLTTRWQDFRRWQLYVLSGRELVPATSDEERKWWHELRSQVETRAVAALGAERNSLAAEAVRLPAVVLAAELLPASRRTGMLERRRAHLAYWSRLTRGVQSLLDLNRQMSTLERDATMEAGQIVDSLGSERAGSLGELDAAVGWLEAWERGERDSAYPAPVTGLHSAEERAADWTHRLTRLARLHMPEALETVVPRRPLPGLRAPWRLITPQRTVITAIEQAGRPLLAASLRETETSHRAIVREIERAREVVAFGLETASTGGADLASEAVHNALSLLRHHRESASDAVPWAEGRLTRAHAVVFLESHVALEQGWLGFLEYLTRYRGRMRIEELSGRLAGHVQTSALRLSRTARHFVDWVLLKTGWIAPPTPRVEPVIERPYLGQVLDVRIGARDLPMLYLRLFRLAPVEDPRFLIGREAEMSGLADALARWESGRKVSVLIVGARGTGKTSLLNCAAASVLSEFPVVRGQFCRRISRTQELFAFLRGLLRLPDDADVEAVLSSGRRVVILEELERIFLRNINGFEALHAFLRLIESSSGSTLWILSTNEWSFRYLDAVAGLSRPFTHRVNAMTVSPEHLTGAVLQRHNLSGLRLQFEPVPEGDPRVSRVRRLLGLERDAQQLFFDSLFRQSEGVFRSAFELWQDSIERVEAGAVLMRHPLAPDYRPLMRELNLDDLFTLQVVLQHGGLDSSDTAGVLGIPLAVAARRIERLRALELLEPEPDCPGFRVRPQARRFVRDALGRHNLF